MPTMRQEIWHGARLYAERQSQQLRSGQSVEFFAIFRRSDTLRLVLCTQPRSATLARGMFSYLNCAMQKTLLTFVEDIYASRTPLDLAAFGKAMVNFLKQT
jgi:hypothetical protein